MNGGLLQKYTATAAGPVGGEQDKTRTPAAPGEKRAGRDGVLAEILLSLEHWGGKQRKSAEGYQYAILGDTNMQS